MINCGQLPAQFHSSMDFLYLQRTFANNVILSKDRAVVARLTIDTNYGVAQLKVTNIFFTFTFLNITKVGHHLQLQHHSAKLLFKKKQTWRYRDCY